MKWQWYRNAIQTVEGRLELLKQATRKYKEAKNDFALKVRKLQFQPDDILPYMSSVLRNRLNYLRYKVV